MSDQDLARDELKLIQDVIFKQEGYSYSAYRYSFVIVASLIIGLFSERVKISPVYFLLFSLTVFALFIYVQIIYRESFFGAVGRSHWLQKYLRQEIKDKYDGPRIYESVHKLYPSKIAVYEAIKNPRFIVPNLVLMALILLSFAIK